MSNDFTLSRTIMTCDVSRLWISPELKFRKVDIGVGAFRPEIDRNFNPSGAYINEIDLGLYDSKIHITAREYGRPNNEEHGFSALDFGSGFSGPGHVNSICITTPVDIVSRPSFVTIANGLYHHPLLSSIPMMFTAEPIEAHSLMDRIEVRWPGARRIVNNMSMAARNTPSRNSVSNAEIDQLIASYAPVVIIVCRFHAMSRGENRVIVQVPATMASTKKPNKPEAKDATSVEDRFANTASSDGHGGMSTERAEAFISAGADVGESDPLVLSDRMRCEVELGRNRVLPEDVGRLRRDVDELKPLIRDVARSVSEADVRVARAIDATANLSKSFTSDKEALVSAIGDSDERIRDVERSLLTLSVALDALAARVDTLEGDSRRSEDIFGSQRVIGA